MDRWPRDYRIGLSVVAATLIAWGWIEFRMASVASAQVQPVEARLHTHAEVQAKEEAGVQATLRRIDQRTELLIEDCYRRGGCKR